MFVISDGRDHTSCCLQRNVKEACLPLCVYNTPGSIDFTFLQCIDDTSLIVSCYQEGLGWCLSLCTFSHHSQIHTQTHSLTNTHTHTHKHNFHHKNSGVMCQCAFLSSHVLTGCAFQACLTESFLFFNIFWNTVHSFFLWNVCFY